MLQRELIVNNFPQWNAITNYCLEGNEVHLWLIEFPQSQTKLRFAALHEHQKLRREILKKILSKYLFKPVHDKDLELLEDHPN